MAPVKQLQILRRGGRWAACLAAAIGGLAPAALHAENCAHVAGTIDAAVLEGEPVNVLGMVTGSLAGATRAVVTSQAPQDDGTVKLTLQHDFVTTDGGAFTTEDTAVWRPVPSQDHLFLMTTDYTITGGSGRWEGASGTLWNEGIADTGRGQLTLRYEGSICAE